MGRFLGASPPASSDRYATLPRAHAASADARPPSPPLPASTSAPEPSASSSSIDVEDEAPPPLPLNEPTTQDEKNEHEDATEFHTKCENDHNDVVVDADAIIVRILDLNGKFFSISCRLEWPVARLKQLVRESADVAVAQQRLIYRGRVLDDDASLASYKLEDGHTIHLFVRSAPTPDVELLTAELLVNNTGTTTGTSTGNTNSGAAGVRDDGVTIAPLNSDVVSSAVFPSDSARRVDPLMLDSSLGNCARRVKLWSSFLLIIYTMKVMGQFALLANDQQQRAAKQEQEAMGIHDGPDRPLSRYDEFPQYYKPDPLIGGLELMVHCFGVYVGCVGFKAAHDTDIRPIRFYCRGVVWLAFLTVLEQVFTTVQISEADFPTERVRYPYGGQGPTKEDVVSANVFQTIMLVAMWLIAIRHSYMHQREVAIYNQSFAAAAMNAAPPVHLPDVV